jgi:endonuclease YncB( thermonuclease family)
MNLDILLTTNFDNIPNFPFKEEYYARVLSVYDGDTITIAFLHDNTIFKYKLRINGIDTPEIRGKDKYSPEYIKKGIEARNFSRMFLLNEDLSPLNKLFKVKIKDYDKYGGRIIGDIYINDELLSNLLIENKYAVKYDGGKKMSEKEMLEHLS